MKAVAYRIVAKNGDPISQWTDIQFMEQANLHESRVIEYAYAAPIVTDEMVEKGAKAVERATTAKGYGWTDSQFQTWWDHDSLFCQKKKSWAYFQGTMKEKVIHETRVALTAALEPDNA